MKRQSSLQAPMAKNTGTDRLEGTIRGREKCNYRDSHATRKRKGSMGEETARHQKRVQALQPSNCQAAKESANLLSKQQENRCRWFRCANRKTIHQEAEKKKHEIQNFFFSFSSNRVSSFQQQRNPWRRG